MGGYDAFLNHLPAKVIKKVQYTFGNDFAVFRPKEYITGIEMRAEDYHFVVPSSKPPDSIINDQLVTVERGNLVMVNPGDTVLVEKSVPTKPYLSILLKPELFDKAANELGLPTGVRFSNIQSLYSRELMHLIKHLELESLRPDKSQLMLDCFATQMAVVILREFKSNLRKESKYLPDSDAYINSALEYIYSYFNTDISLEDICNQINVSRYHFIRVFKQKIGVSPHQFLLNVRIEKGAEMLRTREYTVAETAELCGFLSSSHFSTIFKKYKGCSPTEYIKYN